MNANDQRLLVIAPVEDPDAAAFGQAFDAAPEEVVTEVFGRGRLERVDLAALGVDAGHHVLDRTILAGRVHGLEDEQDRPPVLGVEHLLELGEEPDAGREGGLGLGLVLGGEVERVAGIDVAQAKAVVGHPEGLGELAGLPQQVLHVFLVHAFTSSVAPLWHAHLIDDRWAVAWIRRLWRCPDAEKAVPWIGFLGNNLYPTGTAHSIVAAAA